MKTGVRAAWATWNGAQAVLFGEDGAPYPEDSGPSWPRAALRWKTQGLDSSPSLAYKSETPRSFVPSAWAFADWG